MEDNNVNTLKEERERKKGKEDDRSPAGIRRRRSRPVMMLVRVKMKEKR